MPLFRFLAGLFFHVVGEGVVNLARKAENVTDKENYIDFRLRLLGEPGKLDRWLRSPIIKILINPKFRNKRKPFTGIDVSVMLTLTAVFGHIRQSAAPSHKIVLQVE